MKIALISVHGDPALRAGEKDVGGMNTYIRDIIEHFQEKDVVVDVFTRNHDKYNFLEAPFKHLNLVYIKAGEPDEHKLHIFQHLEQFTQGVLRYSTRHSKKYDLIYAHYWLSGVVGMKLKLTWKIPLVTSFHTLHTIKQTAFPFNEDNPQRESYEKDVSMRSDALVVWSDHEKKFIVDRFGVEEEKISIIPPGVNRKLFSPMPVNVARKKINLSSSKKVILYVGRLERLKGLDALIEAVSLIGSSDICLLVVGGLYNLREVERLKKICNKYKINNKVHFLGSVAREDLNIYYNSADICVLPSYYESFGIAALEAASCGKPVIASKRGGLSSIVKDRETGYLLQWRCPGPFVEKMEILLNNKELRNTMGEEARQHAKFFSWDKAVEDLNNLFDKLILT